MNILDLLFPKSCSICSKQGEYICKECKKLFKRTLPECYLCRRISPQYLTHNSCMKRYSLDAVVVLWEYNELSSTILKKYKYGGVYDVRITLSNIVRERLGEIKNNLTICRNSLVCPVPISRGRLRERGFNQTEELGKIVAQEFHCLYSKDLIAKKDSDNTHQSLLDKEERLSHKEHFYILNVELLNSLSEIIIVDDVITTGSTLEQISKCIKIVNKNILVKSICLFRGRPYFKKEGGP